MINTLLQECEGLIFSIASRYKNSYNIEDLYQVGCIGVIKAYKNYNSKLNVKFSTYSYNYILGEIIDFIRKDRNIRVSNDYYYIYGRYEKTKDLLRSKYCREPLFKEICDFMEIDERELLMIIESTAFTKSLNNSVIENQCSYDNDLVDKINLDEALDKIEEPGKSIVKYRYYYGLSQQETADLMNLSQSKVSREEVHTLKLLKNKVTI